ncbi:glycosyltransferase [Thermaerobacter sp. PB12/4term]|uniref:glycosyltransferase family 2 protein n=1 Tax=Thermaerobacter sp. PB12/4term TaxID=2293838 RepID=UPI000E32B77C|nr:glycosyltransferase [Thermaerobacter sp. PB12/4term]QIA26701.1 glycosyltransferase [Thermaerobacter sp. PB12/4term]
MKVSVLIGSRNRPHVLRRCLDSIMRQTYDDMEVIVLDDASDDIHAYSAVVRAYSGVRLIRSEFPCGVAKGRNRLVAKALGDVLCFIDDDAYFETSTAISWLVDVFARDTRVGIVACKIVDHQGGVTDALVPIPRFARWKNPRLIEEPRYVAYYLGGCHVILREVFERCGRYCDALVFGEEELDLSYRAISVGYRIYYEPRVVVHHEPEPSVLAPNSGHHGRDAELYYHIRNRFYLAFRYLPVIYIPSYLFLWTGKYALDAVKLGRVAPVVKGIMDGIKTLKGLKREVLPPHAVDYMRRNFGRLWY